MSRVIKFRGIRIDGGDWVYGDLIHGIDKFVYIQNLVNPPQDTGYRGPIEVIYETVGQFTGLKDRNGVEIFEGDVVTDQYINWGKTKILVVYGGYYKYCGFGLQRQRTEEEFKDGLYKAGDFTWDCLNPTWEKTLTVIGNIYENTELLTGNPG